MTSDWASSNLMCLIRKLFIRFILKIIFAGMLLSITLLTTARPWMTSLLWDSEWSSTSCQSFYCHSFSTSPNSSRQNSSTVSFKIRVSWKVLKFIMTTAYNGGSTTLVAMLRGASIQYKLRVVNSRPKSTRETTILFEWQRKLQL